MLYYQLCNSCRIYICLKFFICSNDRCDCCNKIISFSHLTENSNNPLLISCSEKCKNKISHIKLTL